MFDSMKRFARSLHKDTSGAMSVEKVLLLAMIAVPIVILLIAFKDKIKGWFNDQADQLKPDSGSGT